MHNGLIIVACTMAIYSRLCLQWCSESEIKIGCKIGSDVEITVLTLAIPHG